MYPTMQTNVSDIQGIRWVSSIEEVRAASVPWGRAIFMDNTQDVFYIKSSNGSVSAYKFEAIQMPAPENFVTRQEFDDLKDKYEQLIKSASQQSAESNVALSADEKL